MAARYDDYFVTHSTHNISNGSIENPPLFSEAIGHGLLKLHRCSASGRDR
jgi:hypothetical protein